ncbi:MAG: PEP/pyruvate-binding domain-containing protein [Nitrospirales bacterium]
MRDIGRVEGKNPSLGEMYRELTPQGVKIHNGCTITAEAYRYVLREAGLDTKTQQIMVATWIPEICPTFVNEGGRSDMPLSVQTFLHHWNGHKGSL